MVHKVHFLKELLLANLATELWLLQVHLAMREEAAGGLKHLATVWTFLLGSFRTFWLCVGWRVTIFMLHEALSVLKLQVAFAANLSSVDRHFVIVEVVLLRVSVRTLVALISSGEMSLEVIPQQYKLFGIVITNDTAEHDWLLLVRLFVVKLKGRSIVEDSRGRAVDA